MKLVLLILAFSIRKEGLAMKCESRSSCGMPLEYWAPSHKCYRLYSQGPCKEGDWFVYGSGDTTHCESNPCAGESGNGEKGKIWIHINETCHQVGTQAFCGEKKVLTLANGRTGQCTSAPDPDAGSPKDEYQIKPRELVTSSKQMSYKVYGTGQQLDCPSPTDTEWFYWQSCEGSEECRYGCHKGYCWTSCKGTPANGEWCYTTNGNSQDFGYLPCSKDDNCCFWWKCAGSCTV